MWLYLKNLLRLCCVLLTIAEWWRWMRREIFAQLKVEGMCRLPGQIAGLNHLALKKKCRIEKDTFVNFRSLTLDHAIARKCLTMQNLLKNVFLDTLIYCAGSLKSKPFNSVPLRPPRHFYSEKNQLSFIHTQEVCITSQSFIFRPEW